MGWTAPPGIRAVALQLLNRTWLLSDRCLVPSRGLAVPGLLE
jgi:hypothetical protein